LSPFSGVRKSNHKRPRVTGIALSRAITRDQGFGGGISYGEASEDPVGGFGCDLDPQYTAVVFYHFQLSQHLAITPDLQLIIDPVLNPGEDSIYIAGVRARLSLQWESISADYFGTPALINPP
jgi:hypothetical protein